jgi:phosphonate transport system substrate-binding protein
MLIYGVVGLFFVSNIAYAEENPSELVFIFQKQKNPIELNITANKVAEYLSKKLDRKVRVQIPTDYSASIQALVSKKADFAYTSSLPFLLAKRDGGASILLAEERVDSVGKARTEYDSIFVVHKDSPLQTLDDLIKNANNLTMVFTSPTSTSGYLFPYAELVSKGLLKPKQDPKTVFSKVSFGGSYTQALEQVARKNGDVAAVSYYTIEGERASSYLRADLLSELRVLARIPGVPTHVISARGGLSEELKQKVKQALLQLSKEEPQLLSDVYGTSRFVEVDETRHVEETIKAVNFLGLPIENLT